MKRAFYVTLTSVFCCLLSLTAFAAKLKGKVTDAKGVTLPYATIFIQGTTIGVSTSADGNYELDVEPGTHKVVARYVGYEQSTFSFTATGSETVTHNFVLQDESVMMKEVVIHANAEDPAYGIIRKAISRRKFHLDQVKSFQSGIYLKGVIRVRDVPNKVLGKKVKKEEMGVDSAGHGILYLCEENADYYAKDNKERTVIHSVRESGNPGGYGMAQFPTVITFYENNINLLENDPRGFVSPISDGALNFYKYKLEGEFRQENKTIYKIKLTPKRLYEPTFTGTIYIVDEDWAVNSIDVFLTKKSNLDMFDTLRIEQLMLPLKPDTWIIKNQNLFFAINILGFDATANFVTVYDKQKVNEPVPDTMFNKKVVSSYDRTANKKDTAYWTAARPIPLEADETRDYVKKDSSRAIMRSPEYRDSVRRHNNKIDPIGLLTSGFTLRSKEYRNTYTLNPILLGMVNYNTVEGWNVAPRLSWSHRVDTGKTLQGTIAARYGFANTHFNSIAKLEYTKKDRYMVGKSWTLGVQGGKYVFQYNPENPVLPLFNTVSTLFWRENDLKIYERWDGTAYFSKDYGNGLKWNVKLSYQQRLPLENTTDYSVVPTHVGEFGSNLPLHLALTTPWEKHDAVLAHAYIAYQPGYQYVELPDRKVGRSDWPIFSASYDKGIPDLLNSKVDYDKWRVGILHQVRLKLFGMLSYNVAAGGFLNTNYVAVPDLMHLYGNRGIGFASAYLHSFQFAQYYDWSNKESLYGEAHVEYSLQGLLSNKVPLFRQARWYFVMGTNTFYASSKDYYTEAFFGVDNLGWKLLRVLRIDFVQSWDSNMGHNSGIRFGIYTTGLTSLKVTDTEGEW